MHDSHASSAHTKQYRLVPKLRVLRGAVVLIASLWLATSVSALTCTSGNTQTVPSGGNIQAALNNTSSFPCINLSGSYTLTQALEITTSNIIINGQNSTTITYTCSGCVTTSNGNTTSNGYPMFQIGTATTANNGTSPTNVTIQNLTLQGDGSSNGSATAGILTTGGSGHLFQNLTIENFPGNVANRSPVGIHLNGPACSPTPCTTHGTTSSRVLSNTISNIGTASQSTSSFVAGIRLSWGSNSNIVQGNTITDVGRDGIGGDDYSTDLVIKHNTISGTGDCDPTTCQQATPPGPALGIELFLGCDRGSVDDNTVDHWISIAQSSQCAVRRNMVVNGSTQIVAGIGLEFAGDALSPGTDEVFTANTVGPSSSNGFGQQQIGISVSSKGSNTANPENYAYWAHNTVQNMIYWGAQLNASSNGAGYQYFYDNKILNTEYNTGNPNFSDPGDAFRLLAPSSGASLQYIALDTNTISANGDHSPCGGGGNGIVYGSKANFISAVSNTITNNGGSTVSGTSPAKNEWDSSNSESGNCVNNSGTNNGSWTGINNSYVSFTVNPSNPSAGQAVTFTPTYMGPNSIQHVLWDFDDNHPIVPSSPFTQSQTHTYQFAGTCRVAVVVWDNQGIASRSEQTITVGGGTGNCNNN